VTRAAPPPETPAPEPAPAAVAPVEPSRPVEKRDHERRKKRHDEGPALIPHRFDGGPLDAFSSPVDRSLSAIIADAVGQPAVAGLLVALALISAMSAATGLRRRRPAPGPVA